MMLRYWLVIGGTITRSACGRTIFDSTWRGRSPRLSAASRWPLCTDRIAARTISAMNAAA